MRYEGGCHCGKVRYAVTTDLQPVISCNCSICAKKGHLLTFASADQFELIAAPDTMNFPLLIALLLFASVAVSAAGSGISLRRFLRV